MMHKRDFELIAATIASAPMGDDIYGRLYRRIAAEEFTRVLGRTNPRFDRERFLRACGVSPDPDAP